MRHLFFSALSLLLATVAYSQQTISYAAATLTDSLKKDADLVYRLDEGILTVESPSEYTKKVHQVITLLNEGAAGYLHHQLSTDKFYKVDAVTIGVYDAAGTLVRKYGKKDFDVSAAYDGFSLVTDDKVMRLYTPAPGYPCTLDVQYTIEASGYIELPNWHINYHKASTQLFRYEVTVPAALDIRQRTLHFAVQPKVETTGSQKHYVWEAKNVYAKPFESNSFEPAWFLPQVEVAPNEFSYDGYKGSFRTWAEYGAWSYNLYQEKAPFSAQRLAEIRALVAGVSSRDEQIRILYHYLQQNMRYVSIQLGIGGFKPFAVSFVDEKKYGDCKALTNYMRYLLDAVGIKAYPALINAGSNKIPADPDFPSDPFNHVILCIPGAKDTTWLECTSNQVQAGELGTFTENKKALLLTENGGVLVNTPRSDYHKNRLTTKNEVTIDADGGAVIRNTINCSGEDVPFYQYVSQLKADEQKELLIKYLHYKNPDELTVEAGKEPQQAIYQVNRSYEKLYDFKAGSKYFFPACINRLCDELPKAGTRETEYLFDHPYVKTDTTIMHLPPDFIPEALPANKEIRTAFSAFTRNCRFDKTTGELVVVSTLSLFNHVIPASEYTGIVQFFKTVSAAEEEAMVLVKQ